MRGLADAPLRRPVRRSAAVLVVATCLMWLGCGGGEEEQAAQSLAPPPPPPAPPVAVAPVVKPKEKPRPRPAKSVVRDEADAPNLYLVGEAPPNFTFEPAELRFNQQAYAAVRPGAGVDSSQFVSAAPQSAAARTQVHPQLQLPEGFTIVAEAGFDSQGIPKRLRCTLDGSLLAFVPGGGFMQGRDGAAAEAGPAHAAYVDGFYMDVLEVTVRQYEEFRKANLTTKRPQQPVNPFDPPNYPALGITGATPETSRWVGKDLPTEAEWEKAARGEHGFEFPWGNDRAVWQQDRRPGQIDPVGTYPNDRSVYGVLDLAGNAREWCNDWYAPDSYLQARTPDGSPPRNPQGVSKPSPPNARVIKGAGAEGWHLWARQGANMKDTLPNLGVRCVLRVKLPVEDATGPPPVAPGNE